MILSRELGKRIWGGSTNTENGGGGVSSDYIAGLLAGYATETWVDEHYISIDFFSRLFQAHGTENGSEIDVLPNDMDTTITSVESMFGFWTNLYISALGSNGAAPAGISLGMLTDVNITGTPSAGQVLTFDAVSGKWVNGNATGASSLATLTDVTLTSLQTDQILIYDALTQKWVNSSVKTINGHSIIGTGDIPASGGGTGNYVPITGGTMTGVLIMSTTETTGLCIKLQPSGSDPFEGGEIQYHANTNAPRSNGIITDCYNGLFRIFGIPSADGVTKTGVGNVFELDPYSHIINAPYDIYSYKLYADNSVLIGNGDWLGINIPQISSLNSNFPIISISHPHIPFRGSSQSYYGSYVTFMGGGNHTFSWLSGIVNEEYNFTIKRSDTSSPTLTITNNYISHGTSTLSNLSSGWPFGTTLIGDGSHGSLILGNMFNGEPLVGSHSSALNVWYGLRFGGTWFNFLINGLSSTLFLNGNAGIGTTSPSYKLHVVGDIYATGAITALSDARKKDITGEAGVTVEQIAHAPAVQFLWKDKERRKDGQQVGTLAQYWQTVLPEVVIDKGGELSMQYGVAALVSAIITARKVVDHERRITELEKENERLKKEVEQLRLN